MWPVYTRGLVRFFYAGQSSFFKCEVRTRLFIPLQRNPERPLLRENPGKFQKRAAPYLKRDSSEPLPQPDTPKTSGLSACKTGQAFAGYARGGAKTAPVNAPGDIGAFPQRFDSLFKTLPAAKAAARGRKKSARKYPGAPCVFLKVLRFYAAQSAGNITSFRPCRPSWKDPWRVSFPRACRKSCIPW